MSGERLVRYQGRTYLIPDIWLAGFCHFGKTIPDAIESWHQQTLLIEQWEKEHAND